MEKIKKIGYVFWVFLPLIILMLISVFLSKYVTIINYKFFFAETKFSEIPISHPRRIIFLILIIFFWTNLIKHNVRTEKEFAPRNMYGNYPFILYLLAFLLGYKKIDLKSKPIPLQFKLLKSNVFNYYDSSTLSEKNFAYSIVHKNKISSKTHRINIIVSDTYNIDLDKIPESQKLNPSIIVSRNDKNRVRNFSQNLIDIIYKEVQNSKQYCKSYNLFLTTPGKVNKEIFQQIFQTGFRDGFILYVYQQDSKNNFKFKDKPTKIKC